MSGVFKPLLQKPKTLSRARTCARAGSVVLAISAVYGVVTYFLTLPSKSEMVEQMRMVRGPVTLDEARVDQFMFDRLADFMSWVGFGLELASFIVLVGLAIWQWKRPGWIVPILYLIFILAGIPAVLSALSNEVYRSALLTLSNLMGWSLNLILAVLMLAAYRGGRVYHQIKDQQS